MMKLFVRAMMMAVLVAFSVAALFGAALILPINDSRSMAVYRDKHDLLAVTLPPRILLIGGSNVAFGLDSRRIQEQTGYPVVNLAVNAEFGLRFMLTEAEEALAEGDIIVLSPEYEQFGADLEGAGPTLVNLFAVTPEALLTLRSYQQYKNVFSSLGALFGIELKDTLYALAGERYDYCARQPVCRYSFDAFGDEVAHLGKPAPGISGSETHHLAAPSDNSLALVRKFSKVASGRGARAFYSFPSFERSAFDENKDAIYALDNALAAMPHLVVLDTPDIHAYPREFFFDSAYHLTKEGRSMRTDRLIASILEAVSTAK